MRKKERETIKGRLKAKVPQATFSNHPERKFRCRPHGFISCPHSSSCPDSFPEPSVLLPLSQCPRKVQLSLTPQQILRIPVHNHFQTAPLCPNLWPASALPPGFTALPRLTIGHWPSCHPVAPALAWVTGTLLLTSVHPGARPVSPLPPQYPSAMLSHISDTFSLPHSFLLLLMSILETCSVRAVLAMIWGASHHPSVC